MSNVYTIDIDNLDGRPGALEPLTGSVTLVVNVASRCGLTPQYEGLVELQRRYGDQGFRVVGVPCNQFKGQEPGSAAEIQSFCSTTYGVDFPLTEKVEVNGDGQHPLYVKLTQHPDDEGHVGEIRWNFEKFLVDRAGEVVWRAHPKVAPLDPAVVNRIEFALSG